MTLDGVGRIDKKEQAAYVRDSGEGRHVCGSCSKGKELSGLITNLSSGGQAQLLTGRLFSLTIDDMVVLRRIEYVRRYCVTSDLSDRNVKITWTHCINCGIRS